MKTNEWHWARLKKDVLMDDRFMLNILRTDPFVLPAGTIVWAVDDEAFFNITLSPESLEKNRLTYQYFRGVRYSSLLEPLE